MFQNSQYYHSDCGAYSVRRVHMDTEPCMFGGGFQDKNGPGLAAFIIPDSEGIINQNLCRRTPGNPTRSGTRKRAAGESISACGGKREKRSVYTAVKRCSRFWSNPPAFFSPAFERRAYTGSRGAAARVAGWICPEGNGGIHARPSREEGGAGGDDFGCPEKL